MRNNKDLATPQTYPLCNSTPLLSAWTPQRGYIMGFSRNIGRAVFAALIALSIATTCTAKKEPLENHIATFNEMDTLLRAADPFVNATNHLTWVKNAIQAKRDLRQYNQIDPWLNELSSMCSNDWRVLRAIAMGYADTRDHGEANAIAAHLMDKAYCLAQDTSSSPEELSGLNDDYIFLLLSGSHHPSHLSLKTVNIPEDKLEDERSALLKRWNTAEPKPPIFHPIPISYQAAENDGELIRWLIKTKSMMDYARPPDNFNWTMADFAAYVAGSHIDLPDIESLDDAKARKTLRKQLVHILSHLEDNQSVVWLGSDNHQHLVFEMPEDYRFIQHYEARAVDGDREAARSLANICFTRQQLGRASKWYQSAGDTNMVRSITANQGMLRQHSPQLANIRTNIEYDYRNGTLVDCSIHPITAGSNLLSRLITEQVMGSEMSLLKGDSKRFHEFKVSEIPGVLASSITNWTEALSPPPNHHDHIHEINIPALDAGFYLLRANMRNGNRSETVLKVYDTVLLSADTTPFRKDSYRLWGKEESLYILCDALTGTPRQRQLLHFYSAFGGIKRTKVKGTHRAKEEDDSVYMVKYERGRTDHDGFLSMDRDILNPDAVMINENGLPIVFANGGAELSVSKRDYEFHSFFVTSDRPVYRPGEKGFIKYWSPDGNIYDCEELIIEHTWNGGTISLIPRTEPNQDEGLELDEFGGFEFEFTIPTDAPLGTYECRQVHGYGYDRGNRTSFRVEDYRAPEVLLEVDFTKDGKIALTATHTYGEPLTHSSIKASGRFIEGTLERDYHPPAPLDAVWENGYWWNGGQFSIPGEQNNAEEIECNFTLDLALDATGRTFIDPVSITNGWEAFTKPGVFAIDAVITDPTGKKYSAQCDALTPPSIGPGLDIWFDKAFYSESEPIVCHVATEAPFRAELVEIRTMGGASIQRIPLDDRESIYLKPLSPGIYEAQVISTIGQSSRSFQFMVGEAEGIGLSRKSPVRLVLEKGVYETGETARILIQVDQPGRFVYFFPSVLAEFGFEKPRLIHMTNTATVVEIKLDKEPMDKGAVSCAALTVVDGTPTLVKSLIQIISPELNAGTLELIPNKKNYAPGEEVSLTIKTSTSGGAPRSASVTVTVYNETLDFWKRLHTSSIVKTLFSTWRDCSNESLSTRRPHARRLSAIHPKWIMKSLFPNGSAPYRAFARLFGTPSVTLFGYGGSASNDMTGSGNITTELINLREDFRDLAYWNAMIRTDSNGCANVTFPIPDGLVKWKIQAWAMHTNYAATATTSIMCEKDFVSHLHMPRFMREGDALALTTSIRNHTSNTLERITTSINAEGVELASPTKAEILGLGPNAEENIYWDLTATTAGRAEVTTKAWSTTTSDGMKKNFPILPRGMLKRGGRGGVLAGDVTSETITIDIPAKIDPATLDCQLRITPNMLDTLANALPFLENYPHGCVEQTLNRFLPALIVMSTLSELGVVVTNRNDVIEQANVGIDILQRAYNYSGEWGWNLDNGSPRDPFITAWVTHGLRIIQQGSKLYLDDTIINDPAERMLHHMGERLMYSTSDTNAPVLSNINALQTLIVSEFDIEKLAWYDSDRGGDIPTEEKQRVLADYSSLLLTKANQLSLYGKVLLALAFEHQGDAENRDQLVAYIEQYLERDVETGAAWLRTSDREFWFWYNDDIETQAWYLKLLNRIDPQGERAAGVARHLMLNRMHGDHWKSTRDTAIAIEALAEFAKNNQPKSGAAKPIVTLNGECLDGPENAELKPGVNTLTLSSPSGAPLFHDVTWSYYSKENPITAETCELVTIERKYYRPAENKDNRVAIQPGETVAIGERIEVELTIQASQRLEYLLAEDFKPAGFETIDQTSGYAGGAYREFHDERVSFYLHALSKGETRFRYEMRAEFAGTLSAHPATIELMYEPRQAANTEERVLKIKR